MMTKSDIRKYLGSFFKVPKGKWNVIGYMFRWGPFVQLFIFPFIVASIFNQTQVLALLIFLLLLVICCLLLIYLIIAEERGDIKNG